MRSGLQKRNVILITDGDRAARRAVETVARKVGGRTISRSAGNPTPLTGEEMVRYILAAAHDPVFVMFDDKGNSAEGNGERALRYVAARPEIEVIGAIAVASNTECVRGTQVDFSIDAYGNIVKGSVDKYGVPVADDKVYGDTVGVLNDLSVPVIIGMGDIGKMDAHDGKKTGYPVTKKAVNIILNIADHAGKPNA